MSDGYKQVVSAVIRRGPRILLTQRHPDGSYPWMWECAGGKVELGEDFRDALKREMVEELGIAVVVAPKALLTMRIDKNENEGIRDSYELHFYECIQVNSDPIVMKVAAGMGWFTLDEMDRLDLLPGNVRLVTYLRFNAEGRALVAQWSS